MRKILNFNTRTLNARLFIHPNEYHISNQIEDDYQFYIDLNENEFFIDWVKTQPTEEYNLGEFVSDILFNNDDDFWGCYYPRYEGHSEKREKSRIAPL